MVRVLFFTLFLLLSGCSKGQGISLMPYEDPSASFNEFNVCHGFGCSYKSSVRLNDPDIRRALLPLRRAPRNAETERLNIAASIALLERAVQKSAGLVPDIGQAQTFEKDQDQMDCLDETINTSQYLKLMQAEGLFKFHKVHDPVHRGFFVDGLWPHNSAAVEEISNGAVYAIDSYYSDNGGKVHVVPLDVWLDEWRPDDLKE